MRRGEGMATIEFQQLLCSCAFRCAVKRYQEMVAKDPEAALDKFGAMLRWFQAVTKVTRAHHETVLGRTKPTAHGC